MTTHEDKRIAEEKAAKKAGRTERKQKTKKEKKSTDDQRLQGCEISSSECAACSGLYEDDVNDDVNNDGDVTCDWIQCTNEQCSL